MQVQAWMGHADVDTTMTYMHHRSRTGDARLLSAPSAFVIPAAIELGRVVRHLAELGITTENHE